MRIGVLTTSFPLAETSSSGVFVKNLVGHLARHAEITVITPAPAAGATERCIPYAVRLFRYAPQPLQILAHRPGGIPVALRTHRWLLLLVPVFLIAMFLACLKHFLRADVIHANWAACGAVGGLAGRLIGVPVVTTLRGSDVMRIQRSRVDRFFLQVCLATNAQVVCVSDAIRRSISEFFPLAKHKLLTIPNGVADEFMVLARDYRPLTSGLRLATVGNLIPLKSVHTAIEALGDIGNAVSELFIIGDGPELRRLEALAQHMDKAGIIQFLGAIPPAQIPAQLAQVDVFVFTSTSEGRPNAVLEAMAAGLPIVASRIDGVTELITDNVTGLLFEAGDSKALAACLTRLAADAKLRQRLGSSARQAILDRGLTWEHTAAEYLRVYNACTKRASLDQF